MKNEIHCNVIVDLLPLYHDGVCSEESRQLIEEHFETCQECRRLCQKLNIPEPVPELLPDETETFRKFSKKIKHTRISNIILIIISIMMFLLGAASLSWYVLKYRPYAQLCEGMQASREYKGFQYYTEDENYAYVVKMPSYLGFESGFVRVSPLQTDKMSIVLFIWPQINAETEFGVMIPQNAGQNNYNLIALSIDKNMQYIPEKNQSPEQIQTREELFALYHDEIKALMNAAQDKWGENLE